MRRAAQGVALAGAAFAGLTLAALAAADAERGSAMPGTAALLAPTTWQAAPADGVELTLGAAEGPEGGLALRLDYDFRGRGGWAAARRELPLDLPDNYEIRFLLRGDGPVNDLEVKLVDPSGENVWWHVERDVAWPREWTPVRIKKRQIAFAWGPRGGGELRRLGALELTVTAGSGGRGSVWVAGLELVPTPAPRPPAGPPRAAATGAEPAHPAAAAVDGDLATTWRPDSLPAALTVDLRGVVELGGLTLHWERGRAPRRFAVELSADGGRWESARTVESTGAPASHLRLPETEAAAVRVRLDPGACPRGCGLAEAAVRPLAFGASPNAFVAAVAAEAPRGAYPRGFSGEAAYWTVVGVDADAEEGLLSADGALELGEKGFSVEPFLWLGDRLWSWADVEAEPSLEGGDLPIPTVTWPLPGSRLTVTALATGDAGASALAARYVLSNLGEERLRGRLFLAARPFQVNPPYQFLNVAGGVSPLHRLACAPGATGAEAATAANGSAPGARVARRGAPPHGARASIGGADVAAQGTAPGSPPGSAAGGASTPVTGPAAGRAGRGTRLVVAGVERLLVTPAAADCGGLAFDEGTFRDLLAAGRVPAAPAVDDPVGLASAALAWQVDLPPGAALEVVLTAPLHEAGRPLAEEIAAAGAAGFAREEAAVGRRWREALDGVVLDLPAAAEPLVRTVRSSLAWALIHRDGPAIQPGSRAYARSWIRDGALTGAALLRLGADEPVKEFVEWFAGFQYPDGKVPCCVDRRGAGPVPEHDSHGELIHLVAETLRTTGDRPLAERLFPHVAAAVDHLEALRQSRRTVEWRTAEKLRFFGLLPESISHEGYSARPVHSYWDDTFAYRGLDDAVALAVELGHDGLAAEWARRRDELRADLVASIARTREHFGIAYLPGSADLGDFDSTATTVMLDPGGLGPYLPREALEATFERFYDEWRARQAGSTAWDAYTPYEIRHVGAFVRLGWKERAHELLAGYLADRRPAGWNGWPEVVTRDPREPRFIGDMPHGWVASDFVRSVLDLLVYEDRSTGALVLAAGVPESWLARPEGVAVKGLETPWGSLGYRLEREGGGVRYRLDPVREMPPGGLVLTWPLAGRPGAARADGEPVPLGAGGEVVLHRRAIEVELAGEGEAAQEPMP